VSKWPAPLASVLAAATTKDLTWAGVALGAELATYTAAARDTCGDAMLVPEIVLYPAPSSCPSLRPSGRT